MSAIYDKARQKFLQGDIDWASDDINAVLVDTADYTVDLAADEFLDDIPSGARVATAGPLTGKSTTAGVADADDVSFTTVVGDVSEALVLYVDTGVEGTSALIAYIDSATGLPVTPNGGNINVAWNSGSNKIFKL